MHDFILFVLWLTSNKLFLALLYPAVGLWAYRRCWPRLLPSVRVLAVVLFLAQIAVIVAALQIRPILNEDFGEWLWHLDLEWNIPSMLASAQLALVSSVALIIAWRARGHANWLRLYFGAIGLIFLLLALDEYFQLDGSLQYAIYVHRRLLFSVSGAAVVIVTWAVAARAPTRMRLWYACFFIGFAASGFAAVVLDYARALRPCLMGGEFLRLIGCISPYVLEEAVEFLGVWLALLGMLGHFSSLSPPPSVLARRILFVAPPAWILFLFVNAPFQHVPLPDWAEPASIQFEDGTHVHGYSLEAGGLDVSVIMYLPQGDASSRRGFSIHLIDQVSGESVAHANDHVSREDKASHQYYDYRPLYRQRINVKFKEPTPANRAFIIVLTLWREQGGGFPRERIVSSDLPLLSDTQVILGEMVLPAISAPAQSTPLATFDTGFALAAVGMPEQAQAGQQLDIAFTWRSEAAGTDDYSQFLHFVHVSTPGEGAESVESGEWWGYDQSPLGARLPPRLWYAGLVDSETWTVPLPADLVPGPYAVYTGLYRVSDQERVPATGPAGKPWPDNRVALGFLHIQ